MLTLNILARARLIAGMAAAIGLLIAAAARGNDAAFDVRFGDPAPLLSPQSSVLSLSAVQEDENDPVKAAALVREAVKARGGEVYLRVKTVVSRGQYTAYDKGVSGNPVPFVDYVVYPSRERTEFGKGDERFVQTNSEISNWVYDGSQRMIRDQKDEQVKRFQEGLRYDLEHLLRLASRPQTEVKLAYIGRREVWRNTFAESVRVEFPDGGSAIVNFDSRTRLPVSAEYKTVGEQGPVNNEARFYRWVEFGGIQFPTLQDFYRDGKQSAHVSFDEVSFNVDVPDKLFVKPLSIKEVK
jgi:hypothetical protein